MRRREGSRSDHPHQDPGRRYEPVRGLESHAGAMAYRARRSRGERPPRRGQGVGDSARLWVARGVPMLDRAQGFEAASMAGQCGRLTPGGPSPLGARRGRGFGPSKARRISHPLPLALGSYISVALAWRCIATTDRCCMVANMLRAIPGLAHSVPPHMSLCAKGLEMCRSLHLGSNAFSLTP